MPARASASIARIFPRRRHDAPRSRTAPRGMPAALRRRLDTDDARTETQHVQIVVLDALPGRKRVVTERGARPRHLVGRHRCTDPAATDEHAAFRPALDDRRGDGAREIRIVRRRRVEAPAVDDLVARALQLADDALFQRKPRVIAPDRDDHVRPLLRPRSARTWPATFSAVNPSRSRLTSPGADAP